LFRKLKNETSHLKTASTPGSRKYCDFFEKDLSLNNSIRKLKGIKWSQTNKCWYVPLNSDSYNEIQTALKEIAAINNQELKQYLEKRNQVAATVMPVSSKKIAAIPAITSSAWRLSKENLVALEQFIEQLKLKSYSPSTIRTYRNEFMQLLQLLKTKAVNELMPGDLRRYMVYAMEKEGIKENTAHSRLNALKFYFEQVLGREKFFWDIPRPKKQQLLPRFFNQNDIVAIIKNTWNLKHKLMLMLSYSAGLRVSEVVAMKTRNIDESRMTILIEQAKGKKDRMVSLSPVLLVMLREYINKYKPEVQGYLFAGQWKGEPYSSRSLQLVLAAAKQRAGVLKPGSVHALRHSFATHLLDKGTDVTMIMKLLGHNDIKTTLRYLHVTNRDILQIVSPLDDLKLE